ncbi:MAG: prolyl oligopeptidase family serine peptidase [Acidimicrobiia bacterium]|nr:prolyl oligopeptidase family serine peptidase [Acidimicrobiia bacterium]
MAAIAIEGPGEGATRLHGLTVDLTNYERAISAVIDFLEARPDIDAGRIGVYGMSMGSYWGLRAAAHDRRLRAVATALGCYGDMEIIFNRAHPNFKRNYMYMSGYTDEAAFDRELGSRMNVWDLADRIDCPIFMGFGEFDELTPIEDTLRFYELLRSPKELCVFEQEFHPIGGVAAELMQFSANWLSRAFQGAFDGGRDERRYMRRWGAVQVGDATPPWWSGAAPVGVPARPRRES